MNQNYLPVFAAAPVSVSMRIKCVKPAISSRSRSTQGNVLLIAIKIRFVALDPSWFIRVKGVKWEVWTDVVSSSVKVGSLVVTTVYTARH